LKPTRTLPDWADAIAGCAAEAQSANRLIRMLARLEADAIELCRLLERWARGEPEPSTPGRRTEALRELAVSLEATLAELREPLDLYLLELEAASAEGRSWFGEPSDAELVDWQPVLDRAGVQVDPHRVAAVYLELAVLVRALEGLSSAVRWDAIPGRGSLWAGLFDLRENLLGRLPDELQALSAP
jgi:hypothetical protein